MLSMEKEKLEFTDKTLVRLDHGVRTEFKKALLDLSGSPVAQFSGGDPTMEATTNALWLWFARMDQAKAEAFLAEEFPKLEGFMRQRVAARAKQGGVFSGGDESDAADDAASKAAKKSKRKGA
jgi:hypothetical protein